MGINAQGAANPFPGTLLDYSGLLKLLPITVSSQTYFEWTMEFSTEPQVCLALMSPSQLSCLPQYSPTLPPSRQTCRPKHALPCTLTHCPDSCTLRSPRCSWRKPWATGSRAASAA